MGAFLRTQVFIILVVFQGRVGRTWEMEEEDPQIPVPRPVPESIRLKYNAQSRVKQREYAEEEAATVIFKLPIRTSKITLLELPHLLRVNHTLLGRSFKPSVF